jgi:hypothetical protein
MESVTDNVFIEDEYDEEELVDTGDEGEVLAPSSGSTGLLLACLVAAAVLLGGRGCRSASVLIHTV